MFEIGPYTIAKRTVLAPMAGITDQPFRRLCREYGAGLVVSEMVTSDARLWNSRKSAFRLNHQGDQEPISVQIAGAEPELMAHAAQLNVERGAQIIDINMGCPAKKVCNKAAGSALLKDEPLVHAILTAVTEAVDVPVTLKFRTGWNQEQKNAITIAKMAEDVGISALALHGRTRACGYKGTAEYDTIAQVKQAVGIPVFANGDITNGPQAKTVLEHTGADAVMIGRGAQGRPWIFREINHYLETGEQLDPPSLDEVHQTLTRHVLALHSFYGDYLGVRIARKHVNWYLQHLEEGKSFRKTFNVLETTCEQVNAINAFFANARAAILAA